MSNYNAPPHIHALINDIRAIWMDIAQEELAPPPEVIGDMLWRYSTHAVETAVKKTARRYASGNLDMSKNWVGYLHVVARNIDAELIPSLVPDERT